MTPQKTESGKQSVGRDIITVNNKGNYNAIAVGPRASAVVSHGGPLPKDFPAWRKQLVKAIDASSKLAPADKADLKESVVKIAKEGARGKQAEPGRLERLVNTLGVMAPDIFDVAISTLANPLAGIGLVAKKISDHAAKLEAKPG